MKYLSRKPQPAPQWMVVYIAYNLPEAYIIAGRLQSENILTITQQAPGATALGITFGNLGEINILVHPENYEKALNILELPDLPALPEDTNQIIYLDKDDDTK